MDQKHFNYFYNHKSKLLTEQTKLITYSFNNVEKTIVGIVEEKENQLYLYEYRGAYIGTEFFISFSKESISYKLIKVNEMDTTLKT
jgi:hypothetical protein